MSSNIPANGEANDTRPGVGGCESTRQASDGWTD